MGLGSASRRANGECVGAYRVHGAGAGVLVLVQRCSWSTAPAVAGRAGLISWPAFAGSGAWWWTVRVARSSHPLPAPLRRIEQFEAYADGSWSTCSTPSTWSGPTSLPRPTGALRSCAVPLRPRTGSTGSSSWSDDRCADDEGAVRAAGCWPCRASAGCCRSSCRAMSESFVGCCAKPGWVGHSSAACSPQLPSVWFTSVPRDTPTMRNELPGTPRVILPTVG